MQKITTHLWYDKEAREAAEFYVSIFPQSRINSIVTLHDTPSGSVDTVTFELLGREFQAISAGPYFKFNPSVSLHVTCRTKDEVDRVWARLAEGGFVMMELGEYPFSERYGWVQDKYGLSWQISAPVFGADASEKITPMIMFVGSVCGKAEEAIRFWTSVFPEAEVGTLMHYGKGEEPDKEGTLKYGAFSLFGREFGAMDSAHEHHFAFNEAISFMVNCETQQEIDSYWKKLSAVPEAEQCGWLKDKYGLSWQIVPSGMGEMLGGNDRERIDRVTQAFLQMKKIDLATLREVYEGRQSAASGERAEKGASPSEPKTRTLTVPGATLRYDIRDAEARTTAPVLLLIGHPMDAKGFATLAGHFRDRTVVTYDPRGTGRSEVTDRGQVRTPELHADDLHRLILALDAGPVDIFASSGGAINALALVARHPEDVHTLVAHEPPAAPVLPDREQAQAALKDIRKTYERQGFGPAMAKFIVLTSLKGPVPADFVQQPLNPADFGLPTEDDGSREDPLFGESFVPITHYVPDFKALRAAPTRIVIAAGAESEGEMAHRAALAIAKQLNQEAVIFPSHHGGFLGGESGYRGDPDAFAARLREVLADEGARGPAQDVQQGFDRTTSAMSRTFDVYDREFRSEFEQSYRTTGDEYERLRPAYEFGYNLATEERFRGRNWNEIEKDARGHWEIQHPGEAWRDVKDAVQHAFERASADVKDALD